MIFEAFVDKRKLSFRGNQENINRLRVTAFLLRLDDAR
jgi:hypothetical protein